MSEPAIRHYLDNRRVFSGEMGNWTNCGLPWTGTPEGVVHDCGECVEEDRRFRTDRMKSGSSPRLRP